jgi:predicted DNA-binding WGR domain protein
MEQIIRALGDVPQPVPAPEEVVQPGPYDHLLFRRFVQPGDAGLFWEAAVDANRLIVRWGKMGSRGQTRLKTFNDEADARLEMERQEREQMEKGFHPL